MWKGRHNGQEVAAKVLEVNLKSDSERVRKVGCPPLVASINELTVVCTEVLQGSHGVEYSSSSERVAAVRRDND